MLSMRDSGPALLSAAANEGLGQVLHLLQEVRSEERRRFFSYPCHHMADERDVTCSSILMSSGSVHPCLATSVSFTVQPGRDAGSSLLSILASEGQDQFSLELQSVRGRTNSE